MRPAALLLGLAAAGLLLYALSGSSETSTAPPAGARQVPSDPAEDYDLGPYFRLSDFINNGDVRAIPVAVRPLIHRVHDELLHPIRVALGVPVIVTSGYRTPGQDAAVNGADVHTKGAAVDFKVEGWSSERLAAAILRVSGLRWGELGWYPPGATDTDPSGHHVHMTVTGYGGDQEVWAKGQGGKLPSWGAA